MRSGVHFMVTFLQNFVCTHIRVDFMFVYCTKVVHVKFHDRFFFSISFEQTIQRIESQKIDASAVYRHISLSGEMNLRLSKTLFTKLPPKNQLSLYLFGSFFNIFSCCAQRVVNFLVVSLVNFVKLARNVRSSLFI